MVGEEKKKVRDSLIYDCFGNVAGLKHCCVLVEDVCLYGECPFYKTRAQFEKDRKKYEGSRKAVRVPVTGKTRGRGTCRSVRCPESGRVYPSIRAAAMELGISESIISMVLRGKQKATRGMRFEYVQERR